MNAPKSCVIGWPIGHSRSPIIHGHWLEKYGIAGSYERIPVEPHNLAQFLDNLRRDGFVGCNITIPHKEAAFGLVEIADDETARLGVVNTAYFDGGRLTGTSTDGEGFLASVRAEAPGWDPVGKAVLLLGAGGAARAIVGTLAARGAETIIVANRSIGNAERLRAAFGPAVKPVLLSEAEKHFPATDLLVNASSLGMAGQPPLDIDLGRLRQDAIVSDIVYAPLETPMILAARQRGLRAVPGLGMLLHQAVRGFELWFGVRPEVTPGLYDLVARDIDPGYVCR
jgi:shikimate dehydrogenase